MNNEFDNLPWHDTEIKEIQIKSGEEDYIRIWLVFPNAKNGEAVCMEFYDCYGFQTDMHFGVGVSETIYSAYCLDDTSGLCRLRNSWNKCYIDLSELLEYAFVTNSTNSEFRIFARGYKLISA